jgi:hypothetical protein
MIKKTINISKIFVNDVISIRQISLLKFSYHDHCLNAET